MILKLCGSLWYTWCKTYHSHIKLKVFQFLMTINVPSKQILSSAIETLEHVTPSMTLSKSIWRWTWEKSICDWPLNYKFSRVFVCFFCFLILCKNMNLDIFFIESHNTLSRPVSSLFVTSVVALSRYKWYRKWQQ